MSFSRRNRGSRDSGFIEPEPESENITNVEPPPPNRKPKKSAKVSNFAKMFENIAISDSSSNEKSVNLDRRKSFSYLFGKGGSSKVSTIARKPPDENITIIEESIGNEFEEANQSYKNISEHRLDKALENSEAIYDVDKIQKILSFKLQELINTEKNYIDKLSIGIEGYIKTVKNLDRNFFPNVTNAPTQLPSEYLNVLTSIEQMHDFHAQKLLPSLIACENDLFNVAHLFHTYFTDDSFYIYIRYACGRSLIEDLVQRYDELFTEIARASNDRMGMNFFINVPSERLRQYKLLFEEIYKQLQKDENCSKDLIRAYFRLKERLAEHIRTFNDALHLREIENFNEMIDWSHVGQFKKMGKFTVKLLNDRFSSKAFLFDRNIIITKIMENQTLEIMDFLAIRDIQYINADSDEEFGIVTARNRDIQFLGESTVVREWIQTLASESDRETLSIDIEGFDETYVLKSLRKIENHFKSFNLDVNLLNLFPRSILSLNMTYQEAYVRVIEYHCITIIPALENKITTVSELCQNVNRWLQDPEFLIYKKYAYLAAIIMNYFQTAKISMEDDPEIAFVQIEPIIQAPLKHIKRYQRFFSKVMTRLSKALNHIYIKHHNDKTPHPDQFRNYRLQYMWLNVPGNINLLKVVAETSKNFNSFAKAVQDNYEFKHKFIGFDFGMIHYSDLVTEIQNSTPVRLLLSEKAIVAVELETDEYDDDNESFKSIKWFVPYIQVKFEYCDFNTERIVIISKSSPNGRFPVIFRTVERRKEFLKIFVGYF